MSRFDDFDASLREEAAFRADAETRRKRAIADARNSPAMATLLQGSFDVFGEWYTGIIRPRTDLQLVPKIKEQLEPISSKLTEDHYIYRANLVPPLSELPAPHSVGNFPSFHEEGEITGFDWNPNVALQLTTKMVGHYDKQGEIVGFDGRVAMLSWGISEREQDVLSLPDLYVENVDLGWEKYGTSIQIVGNMENPDATTDNVVTALKLITPNVINHRDIIQGRRR